MLLYTIQVNQIGERKTRFNDWMKFWIYCYTSLMKKQVITTPHNNINNNDKKVCAKALRLVTQAGTDRVTARRAGPKATTLARQRYRSIDK